MLHFCCLIVYAVQTPPPLVKQGTHYTAPRGPPSPKIRKKA